MILPTLFLSAPGRGRAAALHRDRDDAPAAHRGSAGLAGWKVGGLPGDPGGHHDLGAQHRHLGGPRRGRHAAPDHRRPEVGPAAALESRRQRLAFVSTRDGGAQVWVVDAGGRRAAQGDVAAHGSGWRALDRRSDAARHVRRLSRTARRSRAAPTTPPATGGHLEEETRPGGQARVYDGLLCGTGITGRIAGAPTSMSWTSRAATARDLTPGRRPTSRRSPSAVPTTTTSRPTARRSRSCARTRPTRRSRRTASSTSSPSPADRRRRSREARATTASRATAPTAA